MKQMKLVPRSEMVKKLTTTQRKRLRKRLPTKCVCCGSTENLTIDHILARAYGGTNDISNLQTLCEACNIDKALNEQRPNKRKLRKEKWLQHCLKKNKNYNENT